MFRCSGITSWRHRGEQAAGTAGLSCLALQSARGTGGGLVAGITAVALNPGAPWGDDEPEAAAEHGARCGATLCDAPAPPSWCQVVPGVAALMLLLVS